MEPASRAARLVAHSSVFLVAGPVIAALLVGCSALAFLKRPARARPLGARSTSSGSARSRIAAGAPDPVRDWEAYNNTLNGDRYSRLTMITTANAASLHPVCTFHLADRVTMQAGPVVVSGVMYVTTAIDTYAIDAATCALRWHHRYVYSPGPPFDLKVNRGVAYMDGRLFRGSNDGRVYAIDATSGRELWNVVAGDPGRGETFPAAPVAWQGRVYIGNAGGDNYGVTGRLMAFDAATGGRLWTTALVPENGPGNETWPPVSEMRPRAGGASWTTYTIDSSSGLVYVPAGNAAPDFLADVRPGRDEHSYSLVGIDAATGSVRASYQLLSHDFHDWDVAAAPALVTTRRGQRLLIEGAKDGHAYGIDVATGNVVYRTPITTIANADAPLTAQGTRFCPGVNGGVEWNGAAYSPETNDAYVNATDWCSTVKIVAADHLQGKRGLPWTGSSQLTKPFGTYDKARSGWLTAIDADDGAVRWQFHAPMPIVAGVLATAGGLVFTGDLGGNFWAFDAASGRVLYQYATHQPIGGGVVSYAVGERQLVAVASGMHSPLTWQLSSTPATIVVLGLPERSESALGPVRGSPPGR